MLSVGKRRTILGRVAMHSGSNNRGRNGGSYRSSGGVEHSIW